MPDLSQPVPASFIIETIAVIAVVVTISIALVKWAKKAKENG
jgi:hypothetical protein